MPTRLLLLCRASKDKMLYLYGGHFSNRYYILFLVGHSYLSDTFLLDDDLLAAVDIDTLGGMFDTHTIESVIVVILCTIFFLHNGLF